MNGCVAAISVDTGKVLDIEVMSSYCPTCKIQVNSKNFLRRCSVTLRAQCYRWKTATQHASDLSDVSGKEFPVKRSTTVLHRLTFKPGFQSGAPRCLYPAGKS
ncbi:hypothetical protein TNCV_1011841 [Trichonephila clavipes]|uniref:Uncharacterized protein n=1 Tax=Trichonephila clavipes TaxID=2585209 RepID=A0A8X6VXF2_TRICX|nr:hypothetical protein TNCV_1011841 [Trichonephila clavipes]